jgi:hypothetical protein
MPEAPLDDRSEDAASYQAFESEIYHEANSIVLWIEGEREDLENQIEELTAQVAELKKRIADLEKEAPAKTPKRTGEKIDKKAARRPRKQPT